RWKLAIESRDDSRGWSGFREINWMASPASDGGGGRIVSTQTHTAQDLVDDFQKNFENPHSAHLDRRIAQERDGPHRHDPQRGRAAAPLESVAFVTHSRRNTP